LGSGEERLLTDRNDGNSGNSGCKSLEAGKLQTTSRKSIPILGRCECPSECSELLLELIELIIKYG
jgi:hypothetical protein